MSWKPWAYAQIFEQYSASRTAGTSSSAATGSAGGGPASTVDAVRRPSLSALMARAKTASAIDIAGTPSSSALTAVQVPVPFMPARSSTTSTSGLPVTGSLWPRMSAVISIR